MWRMILLLKWKRMSQKERKIKSKKNTLLKQTCHMQSVQVSQHACRDETLSVCLLKKKKTNKMSQTLKNDDRFEEKKQQRNIYFVSDSWIEQTVERHNENWYFKEHQSKQNQWVRKKYEQMFVRLTNIQKCE